MVRGNQYYGQLRTCEPDPALQFEPVHSRHPNVRNQTRRFRECSRPKELFGGREHQSCVSGGVHQALYRLPNPEIVVHAYYHISCADHHGTYLLI
jgi:hypothetical protein